jgi:hypothetical protein
VSFSPKFPSQQEWIRSRRGVLPKQNRRKLLGEIEEIHPTTKGRTTLNLPKGSFYRGEL